jgi:hypothetical protein
MCCNMNNSNLPSTLVSDLAQVINKHNALMALGNGTPPAPLQQPVCTTIVNLLYAAGLLSLSGAQLLRDACSTSTTLCATLAALLFSLGLITLPLYNSLIIACAAV